MRLPDSEDNTGGLVAAVELGHSGLLEAELGAHDVVAQVLDFISLEFKVAGLVEDRVRSQVEESGEIRHCAIYTTEQRARPLFLMAAQADEIQRLLTAEQPQEVLDALYWLRWSYLAERAPEAFLFAWMALERLVGSEEREARCRYCGGEVICPEHGPHTYAGVRSSAIKDLLRQHGGAAPGRFLALRHPLVHGSLDYKFDKRVATMQAIRDLWKIVETELETRLRVREALDIPVEGRSGSSTYHINCEYRTAHPSDAFPPDCPSYHEIEDYFEGWRHGREHPKITDILEWPPAW